MGGHCPSWLCTSPQQPRALQGQVLPCSQGPLPGCPHSPARTASSKTGTCRDKDRQEHPSLSLLFFHNQNSPVVFRVIRLGLCLRGSGSGSTADGRGGRPHNGTELLSWRRAEHHPQGTTWPHPGPHSDGRDQARGGAGTCPTPAPILLLSTAHKCPSPSVDGQGTRNLPQSFGTVPLLCVCAQRSQSQDSPRAETLSPTAGGTELPGALALRHKEGS